uniref:Uncharacterized protein n=1 Tax=Setaria viridis TaxID=4556 RepID=A0A4U6U2Z3_SETVI|nr:hypothetical protein SEVIR_6G130000v2 [Setaria viridis]
MAMPLRSFHLAAISLVLLALLHPTTAAESSASIGLPPRASALPMEGQDAAAPSPLAAPPITRSEHCARARARAAAHARYAHYDYGVTLADLRSVCQAPLCFAYSDHRSSQCSMALTSAVYGIVRTIEGTQPILPSSSAWRAYVFSGGDVCHVEIGYMDTDSFLATACPAWTCDRHFTLSADEALAWALSAISAPCGGVTNSAAATTPSPPNAMALLPLLAAAFLPPPVAAAVAISSLASLALATDLSEEEYTKLNHAICAIYAYDNATSAVDHAPPVASHRVVCRRPLCINTDLDVRTLWVVLAERHGHRDDPLRVYCAVHSLEGAASPSIFFPWRNTWRAHLPIADPGAAAASGDRLCYVELAHMEYREGYYVLCPASDGHAHVSCTEFPDEAVAAAVWEHRRLTYRDTVVPKCERYKYGAAGQQFWGYDYNAEL